MNPNNNTSTKLLAHKNRIIIPELIKKLRPNKSEDVIDNQFNQVSDRNNEKDKENINVNGNNGKLISSESHYRCGSSGPLINSNKNVQKSKSSNNNTKLKMSTLINQHNIDACGINNNQKYHTNTNTNSKLTQLKTSEQSTDRTLEIQSISLCQLGLGDGHREQSQQLSTSSAVMQAQPQPETPSAEQYHGEEQNTLDIEQIPLITFTQPQPHHRHHHSQKQSQFYRQHSLPHRNNQLNKLQALINSDRMFVNPDKWNQFVGRAVDDVEFQKALNIFLYTYFIQNYN